MTIDEFVKSFKTEIDCLWVKDTRGNYVTAPGCTRFTKVEISYYGNDSLADVTFTI